MQISGIKPGRDYAVAQERTSQEFWHPQESSTELQRQPGSSQI